MITLKTLPQATTQEVFDQVARHLLTQNQKSMGSDRCLYRGPNGLKCAAGCLIGDDEYDPLFDSLTSSLTSTGWGSLVNNNLVPKDHQELIVELQQVHDQLQVHSNWRDDLINLAIRLGLSCDNIY